MPIRQYVTMLLGALCLSATQMSSADTLFSSYPDSKIRESLIRHYDRYDIITAKQATSFDTLMLGGHLSRQYYEISNAHSLETIYKNYLKAIESKQGKILFSCKGEKQCGNYKTIFSYIKPLKTIQKSNPYIITAQFTQAGQQHYVSLMLVNWAKGNGLQLDVITEQPEPLDLVSVNSDYLEQPPTFDYTEIGFKDTKGSSDHPLVSRIPGSKLLDYQSLGFDKNTLVAQIDPKGKKHGTITANGKTTLLGYAIPREYSEFEVFENYRNALRQAGFVETAHCEGKACGKTKKFKQQIHAQRGVGSDKNQHYSLMILDQPTGKLWATIYVIGSAGSLAANLHIVEASELNNERLAVDVDAITNAIETTGHIALEGLLFKFDSDQLLPESDPVVEQIALYIKSQPNKLFYVIGHTDDKGDADYNQKLSQKRAEKIYSVLTKQHAIKRSQLSARGAGEYSPVASNLNEAGQKENRRVELVLRSDKH
ncbi:DUF4892 domain-containing protein [Aestuariirhabdus sp. Z084]|uniref:OmpA family protein n=1 Tax=Aestuariirhabdus haliotis TaxID=2918751 RepID=UPI00201B3910|nr:OmpA family protein [Aestuariirhabdus haliotis]MCL6414398.1 DUF4892 domain-containing protein [Aestuariirhabdus haliotis]MCL6418330.1 DUF4892 domain-containing protein [Aestuariirhabdus haliotis]